jgi:hypothetical protein
MNALIFGYQRVLASHGRKNTRVSSCMLKKHFSKHVNTESNNNSFIFPEYESEGAVTSFDDLYKLTHKPDGFFSFIHRAWTTRMIQVSQGITFDQDETWPYVPYKIVNWSVPNFLHDSSQALLTFLELCNPYNQDHSKMDENTLDNNNDINETLAALKGMVVKEREGYCPLRDIEHKLKFSVQLEQLFNNYSTHPHMNLDKEQLESLINADNPLVYKFLLDKTKEVEPKFGEDSYWELEGIKGIKDVSMIADSNELYRALGIGTGMAPDIAKFMESRHLYIAISVIYNCTLHIPSHRHCASNVDLDVLWFGTLRGDDPDLSQWKIARVQPNQININKPR